MSSETRTVCIHWPRFGPYHVARLNACHRLGQKKDVRIVGLETASLDTTYSWGEPHVEAHFDHHTLFPNAQYESLLPRDIHSRIDTALTRIDPSAVAITSYSSPDARGCLNWCRENKRTSILMNTSTPWDTERGFWREWIKSQIVSEYDAALVAGTPQKTYHRSLGMPEEYIITGSNVVDNSFFERASVAADNRIITDPNTDLPGLHSFPRPFIAVSRLISRKNIDTLIRAYATYRSRSPRARDLVIIGDGPIQDSLRDLTNELAVEGVFFAGKRPIDEVAKYYAHAAALVHPALRDQWGLVVNEAMAAGLPVLVSNRAGCAQDLVKQGENGFTFDPSDTDQLAQLMHRFSTEQVDLKAMGKRSQEIISDWTPERFAERLFAAIEKGLERTDRPFRPTARLILWLLRRLSSRVDSFHAIKD